MGLQGYVGSSQDQRRIMLQEKQREEERQRIEALKKEAEAKVVSAGLRKFDSGTSEVLEAAFKNETVGLTTREEFLKKRHSLEERLEGAKGRGSSKNAKKRPKPVKKQTKAVLSFADDDLVAEESSPRRSAEKKPKISNYGKCPSVDTDFLPDADRERKEIELRELLKQEWKQQQDKIKSEEIEIMFDYWDGNGHRRKMKIKKGTKIDDFLGQVKDRLSKDFKELRHISVDSLLLVKDDIILPHHLSFYDILLKKAKGRDGSLIEFDCQDSDKTAVGSESSYVMKIVERKWYDSNKHIYPASNWEQYDPKFL